MPGSLDARASTAVSVATTSTVVATANSSRMKLIFSNDGANVIYLTYSLDEAPPTAVLNSGIRLAAGEKYVEDAYLGHVAGIAVTGATVLCVVEL